MLIRHPSAENNKYNCKFLTADTYCHMTICRYKQLYKEKIINVLQKNNINFEESIFQHFDESCTYMYPQECYYKKKDDQTIKISDEDILKQIPDIKLDNAVQILHDMQYKDIMLSFNEINHKLENLKSKVIQYCFQCKKEVKY